MRKTSSMASWKQVSIFLGVGRSRSESFYHLKYVELTKIMGTQKNISISLVHSQFSENPRWRTQIFIRSLGFVRMMTRSLVSGPGPWPWALKETLSSHPVPIVWLLGSRICSYTISGSFLFRYHELGWASGQLMLGMVDAQR